MKQIFIILDNIRSAHNVGSIFRTADGAGVAKIYLVGQTPTPVDRFGRTVDKIAKTSLGASAMIPFEYVETENILAIITKLKAEGFKIISIEQTPQSVSFYDFLPPEKVCYVFGNEIDGVSKVILDESDEVVAIPMRGQKESLNVSVTAGIILFKKGSI